MKKKAPSASPKVSAILPATPPTVPSRRSGRAATLAAPNYSEDDPPSGSGHALAAKRGVRDRGLVRSSSLSALSKVTSSASPRSVRPPSSRVVPVRNAPSPAEALRGKPREVIQPKLPPPPGYASDYVWDSRNRVARYVGPTYSKADPATLKRKGLSRSTSAPSSLSALGKRRRDASDSPAPSPKGKSRMRDDEDSPRPKRQRSSLVKLKQLRLGERSSTRIAGGSISARERTFAKLQMALGKGEGEEDSDLSELEEESEEEEAEAAEELEESPLTDIDESEGEKTDDDDAVQAQLVSPSKTAALRDASILSSTARSDGSSEPFGMPAASSSADTPATTASPSISLTLEATALAAPRPDSVEAGLTTSTPAEELLSPPLPGLSDADDEDDRIVLCPVPSPLKASPADRPRQPLATPAQGFYTSAAGNTANGAASASTGSDFRYGRGTADGGGRGADPAGVGDVGGRGGGVGGSGGDDGEDRRPPKPALPSDKMDVDGLEEENDEAKPSTGDPGKGEAAAPAGEVSVAISPRHAPNAAGAPPETTEDPTDAATALLLLSAPPCAPSALAPLSTASTPPQAETASSASASSSNAGASTSHVRLDDPPATKRKKRVSVESQQPAAIPSLNPRSTRRHSKLPEPQQQLDDLRPAPVQRAKRDTPSSAVGASRAGMPPGGSPSTTPTSRRTRSQPLPGKLEDVLSAPATLAATGGFDWAKGRCACSSFTPSHSPSFNSDRFDTDISKHEALRNPSANPGPPPRPTRSPSPSPPPRKKTTSKQVATSSRPRSLSLSRSTPAASDVVQTRPASPTVAPDGVRATRKSFPMAGVKLAEVVYSREARLAAGGWDPTAGKYVSAAAGANASETAAHAAPPSGSRARRESVGVAFSAVLSSQDRSTTPSSARQAAPPEGQRSTRKSFPMDGVKLADLVYSEDALRAAGGGWDPVLEKYVRTAARPAPDASSSRARVPSSSTPAAPPPPAPAPSTSDGKRSTRASLPMADVKVADLVHSPAARQALGGWDPVAKRYTPAGARKTAARE